jgi:hypothetical protein
MPSVANKPIILSVVMPNVVILCVVMLNVVAPHYERLMSVNIIKQTFCWQSSWEGEGDHTLVINTINWQKLFLAELYAFEKK